jgi:hypothetical protein
MPPARPSEPIDPALFAALASPAAYPDDPGARRGVRVVQTHLSWVFLTRGRAYKLRKAVDLGFVRFATRAERIADCVRELRLNRRLAPDVYLGIARVRFRSGRAPRARVGALARDPSLRALLRGDEEACVVMRRLPDGRDAHSLLARRALRPEQIDAVADLVARFHARHGLGAPAPFSPAAWRERCTAPVRDNFHLLADAARTGIVSPAAVARVAEAAGCFAGAHRAHFESRRRAGRAVDGHGDLHLEHVWFERDDAAPILVDCLEFRDDLRRIDAASEVAFLSMDLAYRGRVDLAERFLRRYAAQADDFELYRLVDYYASYRAAVRAKVASVAAADPAVPAPQRRASAASARRHLALAGRLLARRGRGAVVVMCGSVGSGKSVVAQALADALHAVVVSSDVVRKGGGLRAGARSGAPRARYDERAKAAVYAGVLARGEAVLDSGRIAVLDASFDSAARRRRVSRWAASRGYGAFLVHVRCDPAVVARRLAARAAEGRDPSDAGPAQLEASLARFEAPREWPRARRLEVRTDVAWRGTLRRIAARVRARS